MTITMCDDKQLQYKVHDLGGTTTLTDGSQRSNTCLFRCLAAGLAQSTNTWVLDGLARELQDTYAVKAREAESQLRAVMTAGTPPSSPDAALLGLFHDLQEPDHRISIAFPAYLLAPPLSEVDVVGIYYERATTHVGQVVMKPSASPSYLHGAPRAVYILMDSATSHALYLEPLSVDAQRFSSLLPGALRGATVIFYNMMPLGWQEYRGADTPSSAGFLSPPLNNRCGTCQKQLA